MAARYTQTCYLTGKHVADADRKRWYGLSRFTPTHLHDAYMHVTRTHAHMRTHLNESTHAGDHAELFSQPEQQKEPFSRRFYYRLQPFNLAPRTVSDRNRVFGARWFVFTFRGFNIIVVFADIL